MNPMKYVNLGRSGLKVSQVCLGTMTFAREADEPESFAILDKFVDLGGTFLDTANGYSAGASEDTIGRWLVSRGNRTNLVIATKVFSRMGEGPNDQGLSRVHIIQEVENSLRRLQTDVIDLYQIHRWDPTVPRQETARALDDLVRAGKVRYVGCSNVRAFQLSGYLALSDDLGLDRFVSLQPAYNAVNRSIELELLDLCKQEGIGIIPYNPLAGGLLTGKYSGHALPKGTRMESYSGYHDRYYTEEALSLADSFVEHAKVLSLTPAQLAVAWVLAEPGITAPIVGARNVDQLTESLGALDRPLRWEERAQVPAIDAGHWVGVDPVYRT